MTDYTNTIEVWLYRQNHPIVHERAKSYEKGSLFCVYEPEKQRTFKYPIIHIWRVAETYPNEQRAHGDGK